MLKRMSPFLLICLPLFSCGSNESNQYSDEIEEACVKLTEAADTNTFAQTERYHLDVDTYECFGRIDQNNEVIGTKHYVSQRAELWRVCVYLCGRQHGSICRV